MSIIYERDLNYYRIDREVYNLFDLLGDIGGLHEAFSVICSYMLYFFNYMMFENYLVS